MLSTSFKTAFVMKSVIAPLFESTMLERTAIPFDRPLKAAMTAGFSAIKKPIDF